MEKLILLSNENVLGSSPRAQAAIQDTLSEMYRYPNEVEDLLLQGLSDYIGGGLTPDHFVTGNGSSDVLRMIVQTFIRKPTDKTVAVTQTFGIYAGLTGLFGGETVAISLRDYAIDLDALLAAIDEQTRLVFVCNPNNPTGTLLTHTEVEAFLQAVPPHVVVVLDEAYAEFANHPERVRPYDLVKAGYNLIVSRTFSKLYGLAGLRAGYAFGRADLIEQVRGRKLRHNSGRITWLAAAAALQDDDHLTQTLDMVEQGRQYYYKMIPTLDIGYVPTHANFILLTDLPRPAEVIVREAETQGVILNHTEWCDLPDNIRITIARPHENERVVDTLRNIFEN